MNSVDTGKQGGGIYNDISSVLAISTNTLANNSALGGWAAAFTTRAL